MNLKKTVIIACFLVSLGAFLHAQSNIVASGGSADGSGGYASYSVGQIDFSSKSGAGGSVTEGVQQPFEITVINGIDEQWINLNAVVFPNPTSQFVELRINSNENEMLSYTLLDANGNLIERDLLSGNSREINLTSLSNGIYYLRVNNENNLLKTFRIVKIR